MTMLLVFKDEAIRIQESALSIVKTHSVLRDILLILGLTPLKTHDRLPI